MSAPTLVTGGTGTIGSHLVDSLLEQEANFKVLVRTREQVRKLAARGIATVAGDFSDPTSIDAALKGIEQAFLLSPAGPEQVKYQGGFIRSCLKAGVQYVAKISAIGTAADSPVALARWHALTEDEIRKSGLDYTFLHPHSFMQNQFLNIETIRQQSAIYASLADARLAPVDARDIAAVASRLLSETGHEGKTYSLTGPQTISMVDIARILSDLLAREVNYVPVSFEDARLVMSDTGMPEWLINDLINLDRIFVAGHGAHVSHDIKIITGRQAMTFEQFARDHIGLFK